MPRTRASLVVLGSLLVVAVPLRGKEPGAPNGARETFRYHFKERRALNLDPTRVAILRAENATAASSDELRASGARVEVNAIKDMVIRGWSLLPTTAEGRDAATIEQSVKILAATASVGFSSPVYRGDDGGPVIITPTLLVGFYPNVPAAKAEAILKELNVGTIRDRNWANMRGAYRIQSPATDGYAVLDGANALAQRPEVRFAEPDYIFTGRGAFIPNDTFFGDIWGIHNTGQNGGTPDMDMDGPEAWDITTGDASIKVLVMDVGVQQNHPDINQLTGTDTTSDCPPFCDGGPVNECDNHGTAVAGCISATINNNLGVVGIAPSVKSVSARFAITNVPCDGGWSGQSSWIVNSLVYAENNGVQVTNDSNYYGFSDQSVIDAKYAQTKAAGMIHFAAAGNFTTPFSTYPATLPSVNSVAALHRSGNRAGFSNWGPELFISAPGQDVLTTDRTGSDGWVGGDYVFASGTSFASPYTAGVAALVLSINPSRPPAAVEAIMAQTAVDLGTSGWDTDFGWGFVNAHNAILAAQTVCDDPGPPDCNSNGVLDSCDIFEGTSTDCNSNGVPDECESLADCQPNGIRDICEIGQGFSTDCNLDTVPDDCQLAGDPDCQGNGLLDVCDNASPGSILSNRPGVNGWIEISTTGAAHALGDDGAVTVPFPLASSAFPTSSVVISNNGWIVVRGTSGFGNPNAALPSGGGEALMAYWDDLDGTTGAVYHETIGTAPNRTFIVEWYNLPQYPGDAVLDGDEVTFQVQIFETPVDDIVAQYLYLDTNFMSANYNNGRSATIGYQRNSTSAIQWSFNTAGAVTAGTVLSLLRGDTNENGRPDACDPTPATAGTGHDRSRSVSVTPPTAVTAAGFAMRVRMVDLQTPNPPNPPCCPPPNFSAFEAGATCSDPAGCVRWVGKPNDFRESQDNPALGTFRAARLQCEPFYQTWGSEPPFSIMGAEILPSSRYDVEMVAASCAGTEGTCLDVSPPLRLVTARSGDLADPFNPPDPGAQPDGNDVVALINKFKNLGGAPSKTIALLQPNVPELHADVSGLDVTACINAFKGFAYPYSGPCPCPSTVTCNTTACSPGDPCGGGLCVRTCDGGPNAGDPCVNDGHCPASVCGAGFCRDRCGRCAP